jgi:hypothetical protein
MEDGAEDGNRGLTSNVAIDRISGVYGALLKLLQQRLSMLSLMILNGEG